VSPASSLQAKASCYRSRRRKVADLADRVDHPPTHVGGYQPSPYPPAWVGGVPQRRVRSRCTMPTWLRQEQSET